MKEYILCVKSSENLKFLEKLIEVVFELLKLAWTNSNALDDSKPKIRISVDEREYIDYWVNKE